MATFEERLAAVERLLGVTAGEKVYNSVYSGEQIDEAVARALPGGALDTGKAPAGFGLGEVTAKDLSDANRAVESGYYQCSQNVPAPGWWYVHCISQNNESKTQYAFSVEAASGITRGTVCKRYMNAGTWGEWEYINPPMRLGVEYRTTERYLGKPVYVKLVNCGILPIGVLTYAHGIQNIQYCVRYNCVASNSTISFNGRICLPQLLSPADGLPGAWNSLPAGFTFENVYIYSGSGLSNCPAYAALYYTKTTD